MHRGIQKGGGPQPEQEPDPHGWLPAWRGAAEALFLFTAGERDGSTDGEMHGVRFRYFSFTIDGYRQLRREHGLLLVEHHVDSEGNSHYLARKAR